MPDRETVMSLRGALTEELQKLESRDLYRRLRWLERPGRTHAQLDGRRVLVLGSNNYLGLKDHPTVRTAAAMAAIQWGAGAGGSRLTTGSLAIHRALEEELAAFEDAEAALVFASGFAAAVGVIPALVGRGDLVLSDALNHACLIDGCRLSRAEVRVYRHADVDHARSLVNDRHAFRRCLVVTDGVFSMDGDLAPLPDLCDLCDEFDAWLMVDDAHGTGVLGDRGGGIVQHFGVADRVPIRMGTLSKAVGSEGGFVAGCRELIDLLRNRARSFVFSTALSPASAAAALAALEIIRAEPDLRTRLIANTAALAAGLTELGLPVRFSGTPILPVLLGSAGKALRFAARLEEEGVWAPAIRPPTVPPGTSRLRVSVMATHTDEDIRDVLEAFARVTQCCPPAAPLEDLP